MALPDMTRSIYEFSELPTPAPAKRVGKGGKRRSQSRRLTSRRARVGVIYNPRSHRNKGQDLALGDRHHVMVATPEKREQIVAALEDFASSEIDYLIINGGDGTVRDVLTLGQSVFGDDWPVLAVLPKGKTNALNVDLGAPSGWSLVDAIDAFTDGSRLVRRPLAITKVGEEGMPLLGFIFGGGAFTLGIQAGQDAHQLGFFDSLAVAATGAWGVLQALFGRDSNAWRRGVRMEITLLPEGKPLVRTQYGKPERRSIMLASSLERMPAGIKLFGKEARGIKLSVLDHPRRRILAAVPAILAGWQPRWLAAAGFHQLGTEAFEIDIDGQFILDGEAFPAGHYRVALGPELTFVTQ